MSQLSEQARQAMGAVVQIHAQGFSGTNPRAVLDPRFQAPAEWTGTGFFVQSEGRERPLILTNSHVIRNATRLHIVSPLTSDESYAAQIVGMVCEFEPDIGLIELDENEYSRFCQLAQREIPTLEFANSDLIQRGMELKAIGYPYAMSEPNISGGEVTNLMSGAPASPAHLVTDAAINPGNSGGPAIVEGGKVAGINTAIALEAENIGFVTPIEYAKILIPEIIKNGEASLCDLGGRIQPNSKANSNYLRCPVVDGVIVSHVFPGGFLNRSGLRRFDVITRIDRFEIDRHGNEKSKSFFHRLNVYDILRRFSVGQKIEIEFYRKGERHVTQAQTQTSPPTGIRFKPTIANRRYIEIAGMIVQELSYEIIEALTLQSGVDFLLDARSRRPLDTRLAITYIDHASVADDTGLEVGEFIERVNFSRVNTLEELQEALNNGAPNDQNHVLIETALGSLGYFESQTN